MRNDNVHVRSIIAMLYESSADIKKGYFRKDIHRGTLYVVINDNSINWTVVSKINQKILIEEIKKFCHKIAQYLFQEGKQIEYLESKSISFETNSEKFLLMFINNEFLVHIKDSDFEIKLEEKGMKNAIGKQLKSIKDGYANDKLENYGSNRNITILMLLYSYHLICWKNLLACYQM